MISPLFSMLLSILFSIGFGYPAMLLARRLDLMDIPGSASHKIHARPTLLAGGILLIATLAVMALLFRSWVSREILVVLGGAGVIFLFGLWDDRKGLSAGPKLIGQLIASCFLIAFGVQVHFMTVLSIAGQISPQIAQLLNILITLLWLIGITNALNMIDSMDGIVAGLGVIASACFWGATRLADQPILSFWSAVLLGSSVGLYFWNKIAAKFFLGDSGAQTIGFLLASFGMMYSPLNRSPESSWIVPILLLGIPIFDTTLVVLSRLKRRQIVGSGRQDHTYHRLIALGFSPNYAVLAVHLAALLISLIAFLTLYLHPWIALVFFFFIILFGFAFLLWLERKPTLDDTSRGNEGA
ncbi:MAG: MraY family glycosyltransferase [Anaerolineales bacterium]|nr:MraY family glycosyltransferase [Anaerolineales bacterium]